MLTISTWHPPSAVSHSLKCRLTSTTVESLVLAKINRLEVYDLTPAGLELRCAFDTWGTVTSLLSTQRKGRALSSLIVTTDHLEPKLYIIDFDSASSQLVVSHHISLKLRAGKEAEFFSGAVIHPNGKVIVCCQYSGMIKVVVIGEDPSVVTKEFDCRIPELNVHSLCFVPVAGSKLVLAILSEDHNLRKHVVARELKLDDEELSYEHSTAIAGGFAQDHATCLIPVSGQRKTSGVLVVGDGSCHFFGSERVTSKRASTGDKLTAVHSLANADLPLGTDLVYAQIDENRFILADRLGNLCILGLTRSGPGGTVSSIAVAELGQVSPPASITHISGHVLYVGSLLGDSQTIRLLPEAKSDGSYVEVLESSSNIGPICDAVLADVDTSGQREVVTCSGGLASGSLRVIRSGAEFRQAVALDPLHNVENVFPIRMSFDAKEDSLLLVSTPFSTTVLQLNSTSMDEQSPISFPGFVRSERTLAACTLLHKRSAVQVTTSGIFIIDMITGIEETRWPTAGSSAVNITAAGVNATQVCIALQGGRLLYMSTRYGLDVKPIGDKPAEEHEGLWKEVASISIEPYLPGSKKSTNFVAVGYWWKNEVSVYTLPHFLPPKEASALEGGSGTTSNSKSKKDLFRVYETHVPRSLLLHSFGSNNALRPHLVIGLGDGTVVTYSRTDEGLTARRAISLGPENAVSFAPCTYEEAEEGDRVVLAAGTRGVVLWFDKKTRRLRNSAVSIQDVTALCPLEHPSYRGSILVASKASAMIGRVGELNKLNIRTIPLGLDNPRYIAYSPIHHAYIVGCQREEVAIKIKTSTFTSFLKILDATTFQDRGRIECDLEEDISCLASLELTTPQGTTRNYVVVGTANRPSPGSIESTDGRILVLDTKVKGPNEMKPESDEQDTGRIRTVVSVSVPGCVYSVAGFNGMIAAAVNSYIYVFALERANDKTPLTLVQKAKWDKGYIVSALSSQGDVLVAADALKSITLLKLKDGNKLESVAQNYDTVWPFSVEATSKSTVTVGEMDLNISLFNRDGETVEKVGGIHYGELVNKFISGAIAPVAPHGPIQPKTVIVTASGRIGIISEVRDDVSIRLTELQRNLGYVKRGPGGVELSQWRMPKTAHKTSPFAGFIDGDFVESFLDLSSDDIQTVLAGQNQFERLTGTKDAITEIVEQIAALH